MEPFTTENQDFLSLHLDKIQDTYDKLIGYIQEHCVPLLDTSDIVDFVDFCKKHYVAPSFNPTTTSTTTTTTTTTTKIADTLETDVPPNDDNEWITV